MIRKAIIPLIFLAALPLRAESAATKIGTSGITLGMSQQDFLQLNTARGFGFTVYTGIKATFLTRYSTEEFTLLGEKYLAIVDIMARKVQGIRLVHLTKGPAFEVADLYLNVKQLLEKKYGQPTNADIDIRRPYDEDEFVDALAVGYATAIVSWIRDNATIGIGLKKNKLFMLTIDYATKDYNARLEAERKKNEDEAF